MSTALPKKLNLSRILVRHDKPVLLSGKFKWSWISFSKLSFKNVFLFIQFYEKVLSSMCSEILKVKTSAICINWFWKNYFEDLNSKYMLILCFKCFIQVLDLKRSFPNTDWVSGPKFCPSPAPTAISKLKLTWKKLYCDLYYLFLARLL